MTPAEVVYAFVEQSQETGHVAFSKRGNSRERGYVNVFGPSHDPKNARNARVVIDPDGSVCFKNAPVASTPSAQHRSAGMMAPNPGAAEWALPLQTIRATYGTADKLVEAIVAAMKQHATW